MEKRFWAAAALSLAAVAWLPALAETHQPGFEAQATGKAQAQDVNRITWSRSDVAVTVDQVPLKPAAGLTSWAAFKPAGERAVVMGDTVVFQDEVDAAMDAAFKNGLNVTALHNHFFYDEPRVFFMHLSGEGQREGLKAAVESVWSAIRSVRTAHPVPAESFGGSAPQSGSINVEPIERIVGHQAKVKDGVVKVSIPRTGAAYGAKVGGAMGLTSWAAFSGNNNQAVMDGDFIMTREEVQPVLRTLRQHDIHVVALHNHMLHEDPNFYFTHFWGKGDPKELARAFKAALDAQQGKH